MTTKRSTAAVDEQFARSSDSFIHAVNAPLALDRTDSPESGGTTELDEASTMAFQRVQTPPWPYWTGTSQQETCKTTSAGVDQLAEELARFNARAARSSEHVEREETQTLIPAHVEAEVLRLIELLEQASASGDTDADAKLHELYDASYQIWNRQGQVPQPPNQTFSADAVRKLTSGAASGFDQRYQRQDMAGSGAQLHYEPPQVEHESIDCYNSDLADKNTQRRLDPNPNAQTVAQLAFEYVMSFMVNTANVATYLSSNAANALGSNLSCSVDEAERPVADEEGRACRRDRSTSQRLNFSACTRCHVGFVPTPQHILSPKKWGKARRHHCKACGTSLCVTCSRRLVLDVANQYEIVCVKCHDRLEGATADRLARSSN